MAKKIYTKMHRSSKAASAHVSKIRAKGGSVKTSKTNGGTKLTYSFQAQVKKLKITKYYGSIK